VGGKKVENFTFDAAQDAMVQDILGTGGTRGGGDYLGVDAGHMHRWKKNFSAFTPFTAAGDDAQSAGVAMSIAVTVGSASSPWRGLREFETSAAKGWWADETYTSALTLFYFGAASDGAAALLEAEGSWLTPDTAWGAPLAFGSPLPAALFLALPGVELGRCS